MQTGLRVGLWMLLVSCISLLVLSILPLEWARQALAAFPSAVGNSVYPMISFGKSLMAFPLTLVALLVVSILSFWAILLLRPQKDRVFSQFPSQQRGEEALRYTQNPPLLQGKRQLQLSPIERQFWDTWQAEALEPLELQYWIGPYRVDFAHLATRTVIELDGLIAHSSTDQIAHDRKRERYLVDLGWRVRRYGGKEIYQNALACVRDAHAYIQRQQL